jgi:peptidoglycan/xylan/chitin deacetylase (PgdA/CDA1 family)
MAWTRTFIPGLPLSRAPILRWPDNARVALAVIVNLEHWDWEVPAGTPLAVSPLGGPEGLWSGNQPDNRFPDIGGYGNHEYGNRVGIFRILAAMDKYGIKPTLALDKAVAEHYPFLIKEGQKRGAEFIAHGLSRRRVIHIRMSEDEERQYIRASIEAVEKATGRLPIGWSGPDRTNQPVRDAREFGEHGIARSIGNPASILRDERFNDRAASGEAAHRPVLILLHQRAVADNVGSQDLGQTPFNVALQGGGLHGRPIKRYAVKVTTLAGPLI